MLNKFLIFISFSICFHWTYSQGLKSEFEVKSTFCLEENILLNNESVNASEYLWDFCLTGLLNLPAATSQRVISNTPINIAGYELVYDKGIWVLFITDRLNKKLYRINYGDSINDSYQMDDLGDFNGLLNGPNNIRVIQENNSWYGLIGNFNDGKLILLSFGSSLSHTPTVKEIGNIGNWGTIRGLDLVQVDNDWIALVSDYSKNKVSSVRFQDSLTYIPDPTTDIREIIIGDPDVAGPMNIQVDSFAGNWYGLIASYSTNKLVHLDFGSSLFNEPITTNIASINNPRGVILQKEGYNYLGFATNNNGELYRINFANGFGSNNVSVDNLGNFGIMKNTFDLVIGRTSLEWTAISMNSTTGDVYNLLFQDTCEDISETESNEIEPLNLHYSNPGIYAISLIAYDSDRNRDETTKIITVTNNQAPQITFTTNNACFGNSTTFTAQNLTPSQTLTSHTWDFGDGTTATGPEVTHQYAAPGTYKVRLSVEADGGCGNFIEKEVHIYEAPEPEFSFPTDVLCTNGAIAFENLTPGEYNEDITWLWDFGDGTTSTERSPSHVYTTGGTKTVTLTAAIPGCEASISHDIAITVGPSVSFNADNLCFGEMVWFTNLTTGDDITGYVWDFGNGESSTLENPTVTYDAAGVYEVSLTANNTSGCSNTFFKTVTIRDLPEVDFDHAMACSGSPTPFQDRSTVGDGNISSWFWDFGDGSTATEKNPTHVFAEAGTYEVKLMATSSYGCVDSTIQTVLVKAAPKANFTVEVGCPGTLSRFTDASIIPENDQIVGWVWVINSATFYSKNPEIPFSQSGAYEVKLTVNSSNGCSSTITKTIVIDPLPTPDFTVGNVCTGDKTVFTDISLGGGSDEIVDWQWQIGAITSNEQHPEVIFSQAENVSVRLTVTTARGCTASTQKVIKVNALPHAAFTVQKSFGAPPLQVNFKNNTSGAVSYQWLFNDPENSTSSEENPSFVYTTLGRYEAKLVATNAAGCNDTTSVFIETLIPELDVALEQLNTYTTQGDMQIVLKIVNKGSITIDNMDITLDLGGQLTLKEQFSGSILAGESLNYPLSINILEKDIAKVPYICASISINNVEFVEDDRENNSACREIAVEFVLLTPYPNPINDLFHLNFVMPEKAPVRLMLMDMLGKKVMDMELQATKVGYNEYSLDFSSLTAGSYVMKISHQNNMYLRKVMVK